MIVFDSKNSSHSVRNSKGNQEKLVIEDIWYKLDYLGYEAASEEFVSTLLENSNVSDFVSYQMDEIEWNKKPFKCCKSDNFLPEGCSLVTLDDILIANLGIRYEKTLEKMSVKDKIKFVVDMVENTTKLDKFGQYLTILLELDAFTLNEDRHFQNITVTKLPGNKYTYTPIFDNGAAYCSDISMDYSLDTPIRNCIGSVKAKPFSTDFQKQMKAAEELYGPQLQIEKCNRTLEETLEKIEESYSKQIAMRIKLVCSIQENKYPNLYVNEITRHPEILQINSNSIKYEHEK